MTFGILLRHVVAYIGAGRGSWQIARQDGEFPLRIMFGDGSFAAAGHRRALVRGPGGEAEQFCRSYTTLIAPSLGIPVPEAYSGPSLE